MSAVYRDKKSKKERRGSLDHPPVNIVLLGKTGSGKSATGNTILDKNVFEAKFSSKSVTRTCMSYHGVVNGQKITLIDTPGLCDTTMSTDEIKTEIERLFNHSGDGVDAFLLVIRLDVRYTGEEENTVKWIQENFGEEATKRTMVVFTRGDAITDSIQVYINENEKLMSLVNQCSGGYHVFNNKDKDRSQVTELLRKIEKLKEKNQSKHYKREDYEKTQEELRRKKVLLGAAAGAAAGGFVGAGIGAAAGGVVGAAVVGGGVYLYCGSKTSSEKTDKKHD